MPHLVARNSQFSECLRTVLIVGRRKERDALLLGWSSRRHWETSFPYRQYGWIQDEVTRVSVNNWMANELSDQEKQIVVLDWPSRRHPNIEHRYCRFCSSSGPIWSGSMWNERIKSMRDKGRFSLTWLILKASLRYRVPSSWMLADVSLSVVSVCRENENLRWKERERSHSVD